MSGQSEATPYDADACCPKCWHDEVGTFYRGDSHDYGCREHRRGSFSTDECEVCHDEHFHRTCRRCHFEWREEVKS